jgi:hypothetical protein
MGKIKKQKLFHELWNSRVYKHESLSLQKDIPSMSTVCDVQIATDNYSYPTSIAPRKRRKFMNMKIFLEYSNRNRLAANYQRDT